MRTSIAATIVVAVGVLGGSADEPLRQRGGGAEGDRGGQPRIQGLDSRQDGEDAGTRTGRLARQQPYGPQQHGEADLHQRRRA